ncbi:MAG: hypothetical protein U0359_25875 [Byssovorax sp.]
MSDDRDPKEDPAEQLKQGVGLLWRAAQGAAHTIKKELDKSGVGKALDDAGRDFARAANNVFDRVAAEINKKPASSPPPAPDAAPAAETKPEGQGQDDDDFDGVKVPPKNTAPGEGGLRFAVEDDKKDDDKSG